MALRLLTEQWTVMAFMGGEIGSDGYKSIWASNKVNSHQSVNLFAFVFVFEDDFGSISKLTINYTYEFK